MSETTLKKELENWEFEKDNPPLLDTLYVVVSNRKHESGYKMYKIYGCLQERGKPPYQKLLSTCSDVINFSTPTDHTYISVDSIETNVFRFFMGGNDRFKVISRLSSFLVEIVEVTKNES